MPGGDEWQLFLNGIDGKTMTVFINKDATVRELVKMISEKARIPDKELRILYGSKQLNMNDKEKVYMTDYGMENESNLFLVLRLKGGSQPGEDDFVKQLGDDVETTYEPDMISFDDDPNSPRAKMPCGHAIGPESLTAFCRSLLDAGKFRFLCPYQGDGKYCGYEWEYIIVKKLAVLVPSEKKYFDKKIGENYIRKAMGIQECPGCSSFCEREKKTDKRVICPNCSHGKDKLYEFCWCCLHKWLSSDTKDCGNAACTSEDPRLKILRDCPRKAIIGLRNCPSRRACPNCGIIIEHERACKHMVCTCGQKFCFICLKKPDAKGAYSCGIFNTKCEIADIQKQIPGSD